MSELTDEALTMIKDAKITDISQRHLRMMAAELLEARAKVEELKNEMRDVIDRSETDLLNDYYMRDKA